MELGELLQSLSAEDMKNLQNTAKALLGDAEKNKASSEGAADSLGALPLPSPEMLRKWTALSKAMAADNDRIRFFSALKPLLSADRRKKADSAILLLRLLQVMESLKKEEREEKQ